MRMHIIKGPDLLHLMLIGPGLSFFATCHLLFMLMLVSVLVPVACAHKGLAHVQV